MTVRPPTGRSGQAGVTLVEVLVALILFALIGGAGFAMLDQILRAQSGTEGRLERLAGIQRGMYLLTADFSQARSGTLDVVTSDQGAVLAVARSASDSGAGWIALTYRVEGGTLWREVADPAGRPVARQPLIEGVTGIDWQFLDPALGWVDQWPPAGPVAVVNRRPANPGAVAATIRLTDQRQVRRVAPLPAEPQ